MKLKPIEPSLENVPDQFHELYTERNGQFELTAIEGMRTEADVQRLQTGLTKERDAHKATKKRWEALGERDPAEIVAELDKIEEYKAAAGGTDENKIQGIVSSRIKAVLAPVERERDQLKTRNGELETEITGFKTQDRTRTIRESISSAATKAKVINEAVDDVIVIGANLFEITEDGTVVTRDNVGVTPGIGAEAWLTDMQSKKPHWFGTSSGGGAGGSRTGSMGSNPFTHENWNLTEQGALIRADRNKAEQMAKTAGTTIGGQRPAPRK